MLLMGGSLALLAGFLVVWLQMVYEDERDRLKEQTNFLFLSSVREMEDGLFQQLLVDPVAMSLSGDSCRVDGERILVHRQFDSTKVLFFQQKENWVDSSVQVSIRTRLDTVEADKPIRGSMAFVIALAGDERMVDSIPYRLDSVEVWPLLDSAVVKAFGKSDLPKNVRLVRADQEDSLQHRALWSTSYEDVLKGVAYAVEMRQFEPYLLRRMTPEFLFAFLLFASVLLSFYVVYKNLLKQQRLTELKNDFIRNVTHELKTPITTVGVAIEALSDFNALQNPERTREYLDISKNELNRLSILVDKVLKMSHFEDAKPELRLSSFDWKEQIEEVLHSMKLHIEKIGAQVDFQAEGESFPLEADPTHLTSVVYNLIDNALKYSAGQPVIHIQLRKKDLEYILTIRDEGIGIPPEYLNRIFTPFFRVPTGDRHNVKGHGLGLSYVASVVRQHGGTITVDSKPGTGTQFTITIPCTHEAD
ncbi:MAG: HAMP domain-containing histidine kinase [Lewinellaceae bacterium]|nr:HAMP domain-containing histidine kinase [Lewinellaceae bacterium]